MGFRETLNQNPAIATGGTIAVIVIAVGFIIYSQMGSSTPKPPSQAYYSVDDGASYFTDDVQKLAPFDHEGKQAVKVYVFKCADGKPFVGYLERYSADAKKQIEQARVKMEEMKAASAKGQAPMGPPPELQSLAMASQMGKEMKKPGEAKWVKMMDFQNAMKITQVTCPNGSREELQMVNP